MEKMKNTEGEKENEESKKKVKMIGRKEGRNEGEEEKKKIEK